EGTFLGPCILTGRVAAQGILADLKREAAAPRTRRRCVDCHDLPSEIAQPRPGFWHFELVHRVVLERHTDCRSCHAELAPYREGRHQINSLNLTASCVQCHIARE